MSVSFSIELNIYLCTFCWHSMIDYQLLLSKRSTDCIFSVFLNLLPKWWVIVRLSLAVFKNIEQKLDISHISNVCTIALCPYVKAKRYYVSTETHNERFLMQTTYLQYYAATDKPRMVQDPLQSSFTTISRGILR